MLRLRPREIDYLSHFTRGMTAKDVARVEGVSPFTVNVTIQNARERNGAANIAHLVAMAVAEGLVKP